MSNEQYKLECLKIVAIKDVIEKAIEEVINNNIGVALVVTDGKRFASSICNMDKDNMYHLYTGLGACQHSIYEKSISGNLKSIKKELAKGE